MDAANHLADVIADANAHGENFPGAAAKRPFPGSDQAKINFDSPVGQATDANGNFLTDSNGNLQPGALMGTTSYHFDGPNGQKMTPNEQATLTQNYPALNFGNVGSKNDLGIQYYSPLGGISQTKGINSQSTTGQPARTNDNSLNRKAASPSKEILDETGH